VLSNANRHRRDLADAADAAMRAPPEHRVRARIGQPGKDISGAQHHALALAEPDDQMFGPQGDKIPKRIVQQGLGGNDGTCRSRLEIVRMLSFVT
jgi:hypothetical protein